MASGEYFRRQADVCLQLAQISEDAVAARLVQMAEEFHHKASEMDAVPRIVPQGWSSGKPLS
jgi:hypothetical protein